MPKILHLKRLGPAGEAGPWSLFIFWFYFIKWTKTKLAFLNIYYVVWIDGVMGFWGGLGA